MTAAAAASGSVAVGRPAERPVSRRDWIAVFGGVLGAFMAVLDIQITNSSLADIQGALGASLDEGSWISTGYLIAEIIIIPTTGWLAQVFGLRRYLLVNCTLFMGFSLLCGTATDLDQMIAYRIGQGLCGGVLIPLAFTIILIKLPPSRRAIGSALFGFSATFAPAIGPTIGGWLTDAYSWHWIFYINLVPGVLLLTMIRYGLDDAPMQLGRLARGDWGGIACMAIGLGSLEYVLEEGQRKDWFGDATIRGCFWLALVFLTLFLIIEFTRREPFIDLRLLGRRSLGSATLVNFATGFGLYGSVYILPIYLARVQGYNALQIGEVQMWLGLPQLLLFPLLPVLLRFIDSRLLCGFGILMFAASCLINGATLSHETGIDQLKWIQLIRALGQPLLMGTLAQMATIGIAPAQAGSASAVFNMMRNLGGSVGIALLSTAAEKREHFHFSVLAEAIPLTSSQLASHLQQVGALLIPRGLPPTSGAIALLANTVRREALTMAYADCFTLIGGLLLASLVFVAALTRIRPGGGGGGGEAH